MEPSNPPERPSRPASTQARADRRAQHERDALSRRQEAEARAAELIDAVCSAQRSWREALCDVVGRVVDALDLQQCDLLMLSGDDQALLIQGRAPEAALDAREARSPGASARAAVAVTIRPVQLLPTDSPISLLRGAGPVDRVHVFLNHGASFRPLGVLSIEAPAGRRLTIEERVLANAIGERLASSIADGSFRHGT